LHPPATSALGMLVWDCGIIVNQRGCLARQPAM